MLALPVGAGPGQLVTREVSKYQHAEEWGLFRDLLRSAHQWVIFGSAVMVAVIALLAVGNVNWAKDDRWTMLLLATLLLPLLSLNALRGSTLRGLRNVFYAQLPELLVRPGLHLVIAGGLLLAGMLNPATALASHIAATVFAFLVGACFLWRLKPAEVGRALPSYCNGEWVQALLPFTLLAAITSHGAAQCITIDIAARATDPSGVRRGLCGHSYMAVGDPGLGSTRECCFRISWFVFTYEWAREGFSHRSSAWFVDQSGIGPDLNPCIRGNCSRIGE